MQVNARAARMASPLLGWFAGPAAEARFRRRWLSRAPVILLPRDRAWRALAPPFPEWLGLARAGLPFQIAADRSYDRSGDPRRLRPALARGKTVFFPQIHQVLPRVARLMAALRATFLGPGREECSFLFMAEGRGREGLGLHHDGAVDAFWLQLEGRRTLTIGPPVSRGVPEELPDDYARRRPSGWRDLELGPGTLFYLPPRTPHRVLYHERSVALSLTWKVARRSAASARGRAAGLARWDVASGRADRIPPRRRDRLWTQVPAVSAARVRSHRPFPLRLPGGAIVVLPAAAHALASRLAAMPSWRRPLPSAQRAGLAALIEHGVVAPRDLARYIIPNDPRALDGWRFS
jgi:mannose-6-phosphate isomerase-like protein (cupin superfamily)